MAAAAVPGRSEAGRANRARWGSGNPLGPQGGKPESRGSRLEKPGGLAARERTPGRHYLHPGALAMQTQLGLVCLLRVMAIPRR